MEQIIKVALMLLTDRRSGGESGATRMTTGAVCTGYALLTLTAGLACALTALWLYLVPRIGAAGAALAVAGVLLVTSGILMLVARSMFTPDDSDEEAPAFGEELLEGLREGFEGNKSLALMAAVVAGLIAGSKQRR